MLTTKVLPTSSLEEKLLRRSACFFCSLTSPFRVRGRPTALRAVVEGLQRPLHHVTHGALLARPVGTGDLESQALAPRDDQVVVGHQKHLVKSSKVVTLGDKREPDGLPGQPIDFRQLSSPSNKDGAVAWQRNSIMQLAKQRIGNHLAGTSTREDFQQESSRFSDEVVCTGCPVHKQRFPGGDEPVFPRLELRRHLAAVRARTVHAGRSLIFGGFLVWLLRSSPTHTEICVWL